MVTVNINVPKSWTDLSQEQLRFLLHTIIRVQQESEHIRFRSDSDYSVTTSAQIATLCFFNWSGIRLICPYADGWLVAHDGEEFHLRSEIVASAISHLSWIKELPAEPVRLDTVDHAEAVPADLSSDFTFDNWLSCETLWQVYQAAPDDTLLRRMAAILYHKDDIRPDQAETLGVFYWWASVKSMVSYMFPNFFKSSGHEAEPPSSDAMRRNMDAQIRALTKGDITKEHEILTMNAIRALTELDAQAREYDELNKKYPHK